MIDRFLDWLHQLRHGHRTAWDCRFDGIWLDWFCAACNPHRGGDS